MKTLHSTFQSNAKVARGNRGPVLPVVVDGTREVLALLSATTMAIALVFTGIWASGLEATDIVGAVCWGLGFIFIGNSIDKNGPAAVLNLFSGFAMWIVAWLQSAVSADFTIISSVILAAWVSVAVFRKLR